ncbi:unnamed protein product, partial [Allacma fusca]
LVQPRISSEHNLKVVAKSARVSSTSLLPPEIYDDTIWPTVK